MSSPKITMPSTPDGSALAAQQGQNNLQAAIATSLLNQTNEKTPYGSVTYTQNQPTGGALPRNVGTQQSAGYGARGGGGAGGRFTGSNFGQGSTSPSGSTRIGGYDVPSFTRTVEFSPEQQAKFNSQNRIEGAMAGLAEDQIGRVGGALGQGINMESLPQAVSGINAAPIQGFQGGGGEIRSTLNEFDPMQGIDTSYLQNVANPSSGIVSGTSQQGLFGLGADQAQGINNQGLANVREDFGQQGKELEQATYDRGLSLLEPQFGQQLEQAEVRLSERGLPLSSQAGGDIMGGVQAARGRQMNELALSSVEAGRNEQARLFNQAQSLRGQQFGERSAEAQASNQAIGQNFGQALSGRGQQVGERQFNAQLANQAAGQRFGQQSALRGQQFGERQTNADMFNQAQQNRFTQGLMGAEFGNQAQQQGFGQAQSSNALNNQLQQQSYNQAAGNAQMQNAARQQAIQEQAYLRNIPINDIATLMGQSGGVQLPQFQQSPNVAVQSGDLIGATMGLNQQNIDVQKANQASSGGLLGGLMGLGGSLGSAGIMMSDIRLKDDIKKVGKYRGHNLYEYSYKWSPKRVWGVMAQEIEKLVPEAVTEIGGFKAVNYGAL